MNAEKADHHTHTGTGVNGHHGHDAETGSIKLGAMHIDGHEKREIEEAAAEYVPGTEAERKLVRKIDLHLLPMLWIMYILNYVSVNVVR